MGVTFFLGGGFYYWAESNAFWDHVECIAFKKLECSASFIEWFEKFDKGVLSINVIA